MNGDMPAGELDVMAERARSLHRVVRALHDGHCPRCSAIFPAEHAERIGFETCPECGFKITNEEAAAAVKEFAPVMRKSLEIFEEWRRNR